MNQPAPLLEVRNISKSFAGVPVLHDVSFDVRCSEVHALLGENGAGKSTLMNIVSGVVPPDAGEMLWEGRSTQPASPREAQALGIGFVHQELALVPQLSVAENIFLGRQPTRRGLVDRAGMYRRTRNAMDQLGHAFDPRRPVGELSLAERQLVEIARVVAFESRLIILDEPTAPLDEHETGLLFRAIRSLCARGVGVIYISHRLKEVFEIANRVTVLRDGRRLMTQPISEASHEELVRAMIGSELKKRLDPTGAPTAQPEEALRVEGRASFAVHRGEIVGLAGLAGAGRTRLLEWLFGASAGNGEIWVNGRRARLRTPADAVRAGLAFVPDDRKGKGLVLGASVLQNMALAAGRRRVFLRRVEETRQANHWMNALRIKAAGLSQPVGSLSGGTQQKVVLAKWLLAGARVFLLDEPTRGIDVGAKAEIYDMIRTLAAEGAAVLMASSESEELMGLADRILVMHRGRVAGELTRAQANEERIMHLATGGGA